MDINAESKVGQVAAHYPMATRVFARHGIDFCCGGGKALREVCEKRDLSTTQILEEIDQVLSSDPGETETWNEAPVVDLVRHIIESYHQPLREELPRLESMVRKVVRVHRDRNPERLDALLKTFLRLEAELQEHMTEEEDVLFPEIILHGEASSPTEPFVDDHRVVGEALAELRRLTDDYVVPEGACNTWRALWFGLAELEQSLHQHIHLENNILFARVNAA
ncbi:MAG: iron-sulfur cluster repair di-iron protein [Thermoanaerobaculia bacterium]|nr:iron-sulfur cluster repair di-iron protein [Thermoanaerobaculia bacterium]